MIEPRNVPVNTGAMLRAVAAIAATVDCTVASDARWPLLPAVPSAAASATTSDTSTGIPTPNSPKGSL